MRKKPENIGRSVISIGIEKKTFPMWVCPDQKFSSRRNQAFHFSMKRPKRRETLSLSIIFNLSICNVLAINVSGFAIPNSMKHGDNQLISLLKEFIFE